MTVRTILDGQDPPLATSGQVPADATPPPIIQRGQELPAASGSAFPSAIAALEGDFFGNDAFADYILAGTGERVNLVPAAATIGVDLAKTDGDRTALSLVRDGRVVLVAIDLDEADLAKIRDGQAIDLATRFAGDPE